MNIKDCYNSNQALNTYLWKEWLTNTENNIFKLFNDKNISILDLWCWWWRTTKALYNIGFKNILWVDFAENLINWAKEKYRDLNNIFKVWDATNLKEFENDKFDIVFFSFNWIDYIYPRELRLKAYSEINRVLKKGGFFIFSSHNRKCLPINRNLLKTIIKNIFNLRNEYWNTEQSFWKIDTYYSSEKMLENDLIKKWFEKILVVPNNKILYPFFDTFPYYIFKKI
jgi:ubiquinone/menaquinone biosynthesis C-methylase UbiE